MVFNTSSAEFATNNPILDGAVHALTIGNNADAAQHRICSGCDWLDNRFPHPAPWL